MDPIKGSNSINYNQPGWLAKPGSGNDMPGVKDGFEKSSRSSFPLDKSEMLKRLAANTGKNEIREVEGIRPRGVEEFSDLALNGLKSKEIKYLGV